MLSPELQYLARFTQRNVYDRHGWTQFINLLLNTSGSLRDGHKYVEGSLFTVLLGLALANPDLVAVVCMDM